MFDPSFEQDPLGLDGDPMRDRGRDAEAAKETRRIAALRKVMETPRYKSMFAHYGATTQRINQQLAWAEEQIRLDGVFDAEGQVEFSIETARMFINAAAEEIEAIVDKTEDLISDGCD